MRRGGAGRSSRSAGPHARRDAASRAVRPRRGIHLRRHVPRLSWVAGSTISVIPPVLPHLANSDPVFPGVLFLMELEIIWALLFACVLADGGYGWRQWRGAARRPFSLCHLRAHHRTPEPPLLRPAVKPCPQQLLHLQLNV